jgi:hypothetical protein
MSLYDEWKQNDEFSNRIARQDAKLEALAAEILPTLKLSSYIDEIMHDASWNDELDKAYKAAFLTGAECGKVYHEYALQWLADRAVYLAAQRMKMI